MNANKEKKLFSQVSECNWQVRRAPNLRSLYSVCKNMHLWLKQDQRNICIVHCLVGAHLWQNQEVQAGGDGEN